MSDRDGHSDEDEPSIFADLLEKIEERRAENLPGDKSESKEEEDGRWDEVDPLERVRALIPEGLAPPPLEPGSDTSRNGVFEERTLYFGIAIGVILALVVPGIAAFTVGHANDTLFAPPPVEYVNPDDTLYLQADDASYLNRIFRETSHEVAYCGLITNDRPAQLEVWLANTVNASPTQVAFITENCPDTVREVLIHTHPNGVLRLSEHDKQALRTRSERFMCVQGGSLKTAPGSQVENLACYREADPSRIGSELTRIPVVISA